MNILVLNWRSILSRSAGGAEIHCYEIFNRIAKNGNVVHLIASCDDLTKPKNALIGKIRVSHVTNKESFYPLFSFFGLHRFFLRYFDVIVEDVSKFPIFWPLLLSKLFSKPFVIIVHHVHGKTLFKELPYPFSVLLYLLELFGLKFYSIFNPYVVTVSESTKWELISLGFDEEKIKVVYNGLSFNSNVCFSSAEKRAPFPLIVYFGRVKKYKRLDHLILAAEQISLDVENMRVVIAGKGDAEVYEELSALAKQIGLDGVVEFHGETNEKNKVDILRSAWVYAITSMKEGFGISVIEAQAFGVPVVAYDVPGLNESVKNLRSGILVRDGDIAGLAKAITLLISDRVLREKLSREARCYASSFSWDKSAHQVSLLLNQIAKINNTEVPRR
jgi:glycosyltransferase involved in cell wall biosynthesis